VRCQMHTVFPRAHETSRTFCERCGQICDDHCRGQALRERALLHHAWYGVRA